jgi:hypothetical protein
MPTQVRYKWLPQLVRGIDDLEIELESFVCLDEFGQLLKGEKDAVHHDSPEGNSPPYSIVR